LGDLQVGEAFRDRVYLLDALGAEHLGQTPTVVVIDESNNHAAPANATEDAGGWYYYDFTPDAAGTWALEWANAGSTFVNNYIHYFKVGGGEVTDVKAETAAIKAKSDLISTDIVAANPAYLYDPLVDQDDIVVAQVGLVRNKPSAAPIQIVEITNAGLIKVFRYRKGTDADWTVVVNGGGMGAGVGSVYYTYTFPNASWQTGDLILYEIYDIEVTLGGEVFTLSTVQGFGMVGTSTSLAGILADTGELQTDWHDGGRLDLLIDAITTDTNELQTDWHDGGRLDLLIDALKARTEHHEVTKTFFSPSQISVTVPAGAADLSLPTVTLPNIAGTITHVYAGIKFRMIENTNAGANKLSGAQNIQVRVDTPGAWANAVPFVDDQFGVDAETREGGDCIIGNVDLVGTVTAFNDGYEFQWDEAVADLASIVLNDVQTFLIVSYY